MKITVTHFTINKDGAPVVLDDKGRIWNLWQGHWTQLAELPEEPDTPKPADFFDGAAPKTGPVDESNL